MIRWLRSIFAWREHRDSGVWAYLENTVTGRRKAIKICGAYQPLDLDWLAGGAGPGNVVTPERILSVQP